MKRPTIPDLATAAGVSVSTVNRVINRPESVRLPTRERVLNAAEAIGFYGLVSIQQAVTTRTGKHRLGVLLQQRDRSFYANLGHALDAAADGWSSDRVSLTVEHLQDLNPEKVAERLIALGQNCDSVALVAAQHPLIADAIDTVLAQGVPVTALIAPLSAKGNVSFVGLDNWKVGRTAAWAFGHIMQKPGKIGILVGNHRYRNQELNESGFRSYFREHRADFVLLEPRATYETAAAAHEIVEALFDEHPDLGGLFISGGGITGALAALRAAPRRDGFVAVGYELFDATRAALIDGTLTLAISHPMQSFARETLAAMIKVRSAGPGGGALWVPLGFEIHTAENI